MKSIKLLDVYNEYQAILSLLNRKNFQLEETTKIINISINDGFDIDLLRNIASSISIFDLNCNPFSDYFEDIILDLESGYKSISKITSITINIEKEFKFEKIQNIDYIFFNKESAISCIPTIQTKELSKKINIGIINSEDMETELFNFINITETTQSLDPQVIKITDETIKHIEFYLSNNRNNDHTYYFNPYSFVIINRYLETNTDLSTIIKTKFYKEMLQSLSDKKQGDSFIIRGDKNISICSLESFPTINYKNFIDIFLFLISHQKFTEKFIITKKVITLYINEKETIKDLDERLPEIWKTINYYYDHYIEDNLKDFFKTKDQLLKEAMSVSKVIYEQTDKIGNSIIASIISTIILLITTLYRTADGLNNMYASSFILIFFLFSVGYYHLISDSALKRYELTKAQFEHFISEISIIRKDEVDLIKEKYIIHPFKELNNTLRRLLILLITINIFLIVAFIVFYV
jgi:hypothetical protein